MQPGTAAKIIAACLGLSGFAVAVASGLAADNPADIVLTRALIALVACQVIGLLIGIAAERVVRERIAYLAAARRTESARIANTPEPAVPATGEVLPR